jgi:hypothetical protein
MLPSRGIALSALTFSTFAIPSAGFTTHQHFNLRCLHKTATSPLLLSHNCLQLHGLRRPRQGAIGASALHFRSKSTGIALATAAAALLVGSPAFAEGLASTATSGGILTSALAVGGEIAGSASSFLSSPEMKDLGVYLVKTLIAWGVPVGAVGLVIVSAIASATRKDRDGDGDGDPSSPGNLLAMLRGQKPGEPVEYLKVETTRADLRKREGSEEERQ